MLLYVVMSKLYVWCCYVWVTLCVVPGNVISGVNVASLAWLHVSYSVFCTIAVASVLVLGGGSNGSVRALPDVSVLYIRAATTVSDLLVPLAFA